MGKPTKTTAIATADQPKADEMKFHPSTSAWFSAVRSGDYGAVQKAIDGGQFVDERDSHGWTALHLACNCGHSDICQLLVSRRANRVLVNLGFAPLDMCRLKSEDTQITAVGKRSCEMTLRSFEDGVTAKNWSLLSPSKKSKRPNYRWVRTPNVEPNVVEEVKEPPPGVRVPIDTLRHAATVELSLKDYAVQQAKMRDFEFQAASGSNALPSITGPSSGAGMYPLEQIVDDTRWGFRQRQLASYMLLQQAHSHQHPQEAVATAAAAAGELARVYRHESSTKKGAGDGLIVRADEPIASALLRGDGTEEGRQVLFQSQNALLAQQYVQLYGNPGAHATNGGASNAQYSERFGGVLSASTAVSEKNDNGTSSGTTVTDETPSSVGVAGPANPIEAEARHREEDAALLEVQMTRIRAAHAAAAAATAEDHHKRLEEELARLREAEQRLASLLQHDKLHTNLPRVMPSHQQVDGQQQLVANNVVPGLHHVPQPPPFQFAHPREGVALVPHTVAPPPVSTQHVSVAMLGEDPTLWVLSRDPATARLFYFNTNDGKSQWEKPEGYEAPANSHNAVYNGGVHGKALPLRWLPPNTSGDAVQAEQEWVHLKHPVTGHIFYYNKRTKTSQWEQPTGYLMHPSDIDAGTNDGWVKMQDPETGLQFYYNNNAATQQWDRPDGFTTPPSCSGSESFGISGDVQLRDRPPPKLVAAPNTTVSTNATGVANSDDTLVPGALGGVGNQRDMVHYLLPSSYKQPNAELQQLRHVTTMQFNHPVPPAPLVEPEWWKLPPEDMNIGFPCDVVSIRDEVYNNTCSAATLAACCGCCGFKGTQHRIVRRKFDEKTGGYHIETQKAVRDKHNGEGSERPMLRIIRSTRSVERLPASRDFPPTADDEVASSRVILAAVSKDGPQVHLYDEAFTDLMELEVIDEDTLVVLLPGGFEARLSPSPARKLYDALSGVTALHFESYPAKCLLLEYRRALKRELSMEEVGARSVSDEERLRLQYERRLKELIALYKEVDLSRHRAAGRSSWSHALGDKEMREQILKEIEELRALAAQLKHSRREHGLDSNAWLELFRSRYRISLAALKQRLQREKEVERIEGSRMEYQKALLAEREKHRLQHEVDKLENFHYLAEHGVPLFDDEAEEEPISCLDRVLRCCGLVRVSQIARHERVAPFLSESSTPPPNEATTSVQSPSNKPPLTTAVQQQSEGAVSSPTNPDKEYEQQTLTPSALSPTQQSSPPYDTTKAGTSTKPKQLQPHFAVNKPAALTPYGAPQPAGYEEKNNHK